MNDLWNHVSRCYEASRLPHNYYLAGGIYARHAQYFELHRAQPIVYYEVRALASVFQRDSGAMRIFCCAFGGATKCGLCLEAKQRYFNHLFLGLKWRRKSVDSPKIVWHKSVCPSMIDAHELFYLSQHAVDRDFSPHTIQWNAKVKHAQKNPDDAKSKFEIGPHLRFSSRTLLASLIFIASINLRVCFKLLYGHMCAEF